MRDKTVRHTRHTTALKVSRAYDTRNMSQDSILQSKGDGRTYKQLKVDGQKFFIRLFDSHTRKG